MRISKAAKQTYAEIKRIAAWEANRGADASDVIRDLLDKKLYFESQKKYMNIKVFDVLGAKELFKMEENLYNMLYDEENKDEPDEKIIKNIENQLKEFEIENLIK